MTAATYRRTTLPPLCVLAFPPATRNPTFPHGALNTPTPSRGSLRAIPNITKQRGEHTPSACAN